MQRRWVFGDIGVSCVRFELCFVLLIIVYLRDVIKSNESSG